MSNFMLKNRLKYLSGFVQNKQNCRDSAPLREIIRRNRLWSNGWDTLSSFHEPKVLLKMLETKQLKIKWCHNIDTHGDYRKVIEV